MPRGEFGPSLLDPCPYCWGISVVVVVDLCCSMILGGGTSVPVTVVVVVVILRCSWHPSNGNDNTARITIPIPVFMTGFIRTSSAKFAEP